MILLIFNNLLCSKKCANMVPRLRIFFIRFLCKVDGERVMAEPKKEGSSAATKLLRFNERERLNQKDLRR
jgi:hypothetical protein